MMYKNTGWILRKMLGLLSVIRGYNVAVIVLAQYLSALFIFAPEQSLTQVLFNPQLFVLVLASGLTIASGYIINSFYDAKKDFINRPNRTRIEQLISQKSKLYLYFTLNLIISVLAATISWRAFLFFSAYIFLIWLYSHKLKRIFVVGNLTASVLAILPFFAILMYYKNFYSLVFAHASFLFLLIYIRELVKDLENIPGDLAANYQTLPVILGERRTKLIIYICSALTIIPAYILIESFAIGNMVWYFYITMALLLVFCLKLATVNTKEGYVKLHFLLKMIILIGVLSIVLINPSEIGFF